MAVAAAVAAGCASSGSPHATPTDTQATSASAVPATATPTTTATTTPSRATTLRRFYTQHLAWDGCGGGYECARLLVPVDYQQPAGDTMRIAVIRKRASGSHRGSLVINPGGPGASGIDYARGSAGTFAAVTTHFDLVSFDPRGVGKSRPIRCLTTPQLASFIHVDPTPESAAEHSALVRSSREFADRCWDRYGDYLRHVGTIDAARDMDVLRAALGDDKLTYYGASYGTYLGAKYAQLFPHRIRALVLDGAVDPTQVTSAENRVQARGFESNLRDFLRHCAASGSCALGSSFTAAQRKLEQLSREVDESPVRVGSRSVGPGEFFTGVALGLYSTRLWPALEEALRRLDRGDGGLLLQLSDYLTDRQPDGSYSNLVESNLAINCIDRPSSRDVDDYDVDAQQFARESPHFGTAIAYGTLPCAFWHVPPVESAHAVTAPGAPPIVVVGTTRDPATPYVWSQALARQLSSGVLVTYDGNGHTAYDRGDPCVSRAVNRYLLDRVPPRDGLRCP